ncbi:hypothetical protein [Thioclava kandeliae]|uniref:Apea-like HEPN domain-containing protein n=1 Tax=Thioclava kandeliae TaxID=3070818 RepID=A0ABV1SCM8_9RHOB
MSYDIELAEYGAKLQSTDGHQRQLVRHNVDLTTVKGGFQEFDDNAFFACACISPRVKSSDFTKIRCKKTEQLIGWFIPALYYSEPWEFTDQKFLSDFAYAGFVKYWKSRSFESIRRNFHAEITEGESDFADDLPDDIGLAVFSRQSLKKTELQLSSIKISLLRNNIWAFDGGIPLQRFLSSAQLAARDTQADTRRHVEILHLPKHCSDIDQLLCSILDLAVDELSGIGGFLYLYQVAEHLMEVSFSNSVREISHQGLPAWKLKKKLTDVSSEIYRLREVARQAQINGAKAEIFDDLRDECISFLDMCQASHQEDSNTWIDKVYGARNILIHNHLSVLRSGANSKLESVNKLLYRAILELIFHY